jgi:hypothetical protein
MLSVSWFSKLFCPCKKLVIVLLYIAGELIQYKAIGKFVRMMVFVGTVYTLLFLCRLHQCMRSIQVYKYNNTKS